MIKVAISKMKREQIPAVARVASASFSGLKDLKIAKKWIDCNFNAFPRMFYFVAKLKEEIVGYVLWMEKGGFRERAVIELEQIAVLPEYRGKGIGTQLTEKSLCEIKKYLKKRGSVLKIIEVTTGTENKAQRLYKKTLNAKVECTVKDLFRGDEVIMISRQEKLRQEKLRQEKLRQEKK